MNIGIICELNPLHSGHKYLFDTVKKKGDRIIAVMSGNFVQRGEFAVEDKFARTEKALKNGADLVIELPCAYSTLSAEGFAAAAVFLLEATGIADQIAFGAECDNIDKLKQISRGIMEMQPEITEEMKKGFSYPQARKNIMKSRLLDTPNNILAIEYLKFTRLPAIAVKRIGEGHDTDDISYSASALRKQMSLNDICSMKNCESAVLAKLRTMTAADFLQIRDVSEGLENRLVSAAGNSDSLESLYDLAKTKRYTLSRIRRIILRSYLGIEKNVPEKPPYLRILGFSSAGKSLLGEIKQNASLPIISRYSDTKNSSDEIRELFELECRCTDLYNLGYKKPLPCGTEQRSRIVMI